MTTQAQREQLRQHFARRVTTQARVVLELARAAQDSDWRDRTDLAELEAAADKLRKFAERLQIKKHEEFASTILKHLRAFVGSAAESTLAELKHTIAELSHQTLRKSDNGNTSPPRNLVRPPIYLALADADATQRLARQMEFFGFRAQTFTNAPELLATARRHRPDTICIDVNFGGEPDRGIVLIEKLQTGSETQIPVLFCSPADGSIETRLRASRAGGEEFFHPDATPGQIIEKIETYTGTHSTEPYRVLVLDDSRAQSRFIENILTKAGIDVLAINDPLQILIALNDFSPEIILLDMYMPHCSGMELARVIRQQDKFHSVPIIYLSAEDDVNKQLHAMSLGGDDFLTKPIEPRHLVATLHNRGRRARALLALMVRDSLTGLFNHTHTLSLLESSLKKAAASGKALTFAMLDIDHFKSINDSHGHPVGDRVLKSLSMFLKQRLRKTDAIGRYGGEEFAVILPDTDAAEAQRLMDEIRRNFAELPHPSASGEFQVSFSCGIATSAQASGQILSERADQALYQAKRQGRNQVRCAPSD